MFKEGVNVNVSLPDVEKAKEHVKKHKKVYLGVGGGVLFAGFSCLMMRGYYPGIPRVPEVSDRYIQGGISVLAPGGISVRGKNNVLNMASYFSSNRQGPPSWV